MKQPLFLLIFLLYICTTSAQTPQPEKWTFTTEKKNSDEYVLIFKVTLEPQWHMYSQFTDEGGPLPMVYNFSDSICFTRIGTVVEPAPHLEFDSVFMVNVKTFDGEVTFKQTIKVNSPDCLVKGNIQYQICKEMCIFKEIEFTFTLD